MNNLILIIQLKNYQKRIFKIFSWSLKYIILFLSLGLFFSHHLYLALLGFWLFVIYFLYLILFRHYPLKNLILEESYNILDYLDDRLKYLILDLSYQTKNLNYLDILFFKKILNFKEILKIFSLLDIDLQSLIKEINQLFYDNYQGRQIDALIKNNHLFLKNIEPILINAYQLSKVFFCDKIRSEFILIAILNKNHPFFNNLFKNYQITLLDIYSALFLAKYSLGSNYQLVNKKTFFSFIQKKIIHNLTLPFYLSTYGIDISNLIIKNLPISFLIINNQEKFLKIIKIIEENQFFKIILISDEKLAAKLLIYNLIYYLSQKQNNLNKFIFKINLHKILPLDFNSKNALLSLIQEVSNNEQFIIFFDQFYANLYQYSFLKEIFNNRYLNSIFIFHPQDFLKVNRQVQLEKLSNIFLINVNDFSDKEILLLLSLKLKKYLKKSKIFVKPKSLRKIVELSKLIKNNKSLLFNSFYLLKKCLKFCYKNNLNILSEEIVGDVFSKFKSISFNIKNY